MKALAVIGAVIVLGLFVFGAIKLAETLKPIFEREKEKKEE